MQRPMFSMSEVVEAVDLGVRAISPWRQEPFMHGVRDGFLPQELAHQIHREISDSSVDWYDYNNPLEIKRTANNWNQFPPTVYQVLLALGAPEIAEELSKAMGLPGLIPDLGLHGGGIHYVGRGGKLNVHQDYSMHPKLAAQRRVNLILYLNPDWKEEWGGALQLLAAKGDPASPELSSPGEIVETISAEFNRAVVFRTDPGSWHGFPDPLNCPEDQARISLAFYYCSAPSVQAPDRWRAKYAPSESQIGDQEVERLIDLRSSLDQASTVYRT
jgi:Rps23 Pro-64 3,4-dihydroxylase Tpa1-like proline 4-hydroxylase